MPTKKIHKTSSQYPELSQKSHLFPYEIRHLFRNSKLIELSLPTIDKLTENLRHPSSPSFSKQLKKLRLLTSIQEKQISLLLDHHSSSVPSSPSCSPSLHPCPSPSLPSSLSSSLPSSLSSSLPSSILPIHPSSLSSSITTSSLLPINDENFGVATFQRERNVKMQPLDPLSENQIYQIDKDRREKMKKREEGGLKCEEVEKREEEEEEGWLKEEERDIREEGGWRRDEVDKMIAKREERRRRWKQEEDNKENKRGRDEGYLWIGVGYGLGRALLSDKVEDLMDLRIEKRLVDVEEDDWGWDF